MNPPTSHGSSYTNVFLGIPGCGFPRNSTLRQTIQILAPQSRRIIPLGSSSRPHPAVTHSTGKQTWSVHIQPKVQSRSQQLLETHVFLHDYLSLWALGGGVCRVFPNGASHSQPDFALINMSISHTRLREAVQTEVHVANRLGNDRERGHHPHRCVRGWANKTPSDTLRGRHGHPTQPKRYLIHHR